MLLLEHILFRIARHMVLTRKPGQAGANPAGSDAVAYQQWRAAELASQFHGSFTRADVAGKDVLDFGCGEGELSFLVAKLDAGSVIGLDLDEELIKSAQSRLDSEPLAGKPRFEVARDSKAIELPSASLDVILCFDTLEHILDYVEIITEWRRVLRPGGRVLIWWVPWFHPYGHHLHTLIPLPWVHVFFSDQTLINVCACIYDLPEFQPRFWDQDEHGNKKPNKWLHLHSLPTLNKLTISRFEKICRRTGFEIETRRIHGFEQVPLSPLATWLAQVPPLREFLSSRVVYRLRKQC